MSTVRRSNKDIREGPGRIDRAKIATFTDHTIERFARDDKSDVAQFGAPRFVPPQTDVRALRDRLGLSQSEFASTYLLSVRTIQHWEQGQREPSEPARVLLYAIARDAKAVKRALHRD